VINRVVLVGRLVADPELRYTPNGTAVASLRLAVDRGRTNAEGNRETDFFNVVAWQKSAEYAANYLNKGRLIGVDGRLQQRSWVAQDGTKRSAVEVVAERVQSLEARKDGGEPRPAAGEAAATGAVAEAEAPFVEGAEETFDPFADE